MELNKTIELVKSLKSSPLTHTELGFKKGLLFVVNEITNEGVITLRTNENFRKIVYFPPQKDGFHFKIKFCPFYPSRTKLSNLGIKV